MRMRSALIFGTFFALLSACGAPTRPNAAGSSMLKDIEVVEAEESATESDANKGSAKTDEGPNAAATPWRTVNYLQLPRSAAGKDFLLSASIIPQTRAATSTAMQGRIVHFEFFDDSVDLYQSTRGEVVTGDLPARVLLARFPIIKQDNAIVLIDFDGGTKSLFVREWYGGSEQFNPSAIGEVINIDESRVYRSELNEEKNRTVLYQSVRARTSNVPQSVFFDTAQPVGTEIFAPYEVRYYLTLYTPSTEFKPLETNAIAGRRVRFFKTPAQLETTSGRAHSYDMRFEISDAPITFYVSANTPAEYQQAVKDGILYWNKAFGKEVVRAEMAPEGITAPHPDYNIVQWVPYDNAGFAYADVIADPLTGQALHGQVYMTSVFAVKSIERARTLIRLLQGSAPKVDGATKNDDEKGQASVGLNFLSSAPSCNLSSSVHRQQYASFLAEALATPGISDEAMLRVSGDYVRAVVGHEIGHVLGLRHNFAGSLYGDATAKQRDEWLEGYIASDAPGNLSEKLTSSSLMEYTQFKDDLPLGQFMRQKDRALPYDEMAIRYGYYGETKILDSNIPFCTDDDSTVYADCKTFDRGDDVIVGLVGELHDLVRLLPGNLIERFVAAKSAKDTRDRMPLRYVDLSPESQADMFLAQFSQLYAWLGTTNRSLLVEDKFPRRDATTIDEIYAEQWKRVSAGFAKLGKTDVALLGLLPVPLNFGAQDQVKDDAFTRASRIEADAIAKEVARLLESPAYSSFVGSDGATHTFSAEEKAEILESVRTFAASYEKAVLTKTLAVIAKGPLSLSTRAADIPSDQDAMTSVENRIMELVKLVVLSPSSSKSIEGSYGSMQIKVNAFAFDDSLRLLAASTLNPGAGSYAQWSQAAKKELAQAMQSKVHGPLGIDEIKDFKPEKLSRALRIWFEEQQKVLGALN